MTSNELPATAEPNTNRYGVILCDPPWSYSQYKDAANGAAKAKYECMTIDQIKSLPIGDWAADNCVLALWCTNAKLNEGIELIQHYGFTYKTKVTWAKNSPKSSDLSTGVGIWFQAATEDILFAIKGKIGGFDKRRGKLGFFHGSRNDPEFWKRVSEQVLISPKPRIHSKKPDTLSEYLETFDGPYLELFATRPRKGWTCYGNSLGTELGQYGVRELQIVERDIQTQPVQDGQQRGAHILIPY
jgi:N6-adenosine-specific RNA methylase IME4